MKRFWARKKTRATGIIMRVETAITNCPTGAKCPGDVEFDCGDKALAESKGPAAEQLGEDSAHVGFVPDQSHPFGCLAPGKLDELPDIDAGGQ